MYCIYYTNPAIDPHVALQMLEATGEVECGSVRYLFPISTGPNDPQIANQYALTNMSVFNAWVVTTGDTNIVIADVDVGFNLAHEDLKNAFKINWAEFGSKGTNGIDDDGDGYIDNWRGWDVVGTVNATAGDPFQPDNDPSPDDPSANHGSLTAGCIAATASNGVGIAGVAFGCRFLPVKAAGTDYQNVSGGYEGIHYASIHNARIINCSWGGPVGGADVTFFNTILQEAIDRNALVVVAAGNDLADNDKTPYYPCSGPGTLSVGATDQTDGAAIFSNYGHSINVYAPGSGILSTSWPGTNAYAYEDGTSFASPLTAGVAALVTTLHPTWPPRFIARQIIQTCDNVVNTLDRANYWGRVNAQNAVGAPVGPGLDIVAYALDGVVSGSLGDVGNTADLKVTFKNFVAAGTNLTATIVPRTGYTCVSTPVSLGSMGVDATAQADFQITRTGVYSQGKFPVRFAVSDGANYTDTLDLLMPLKIVPGFVVDRVAPLGQSIKRVSNTAAWAAFGYGQGGSAPVGKFAAQRGGIWGDTTKLAAGNEAPYDVEALDSMTAYFGSGHTVGTKNYGYVISTLDGGSTFTTVDVNSFTPFVNSIHFFDANNGVFIGDPLNQVWGIGVTTDAGKTWKRSTKANSVASSAEASWNNATAWVGNNGWFGSNSSHIWRTNDRGQTWTSAKTAYQNCLSLSFDDDALHGIACFRPVTSATGGTTGTKALMLSTDGGASWKFLKAPVPGLVPGSVQFVTGTNTAILTSDSGIYRTSDFGTTWVPIGVPTSYDALDGGISVWNAGGLLTVSCLSSSNGIATYTEGALSTTGGVTFSPTAVNFGTVTVDSPKTLTLTLKNNTTSTVVVDSVTITSATGDFSAANATFPITLATEQSVSVDLTFKPVASGSFSGVLTIGQSGQPPVQVPLSGIGQLLQGGVAASPDDRSSGVASVDIQLTASPNPFRRTTQLRFDLDKSQVVRLSVFDAVGREVALLANGLESAGGHTATLDGGSLPAGVYYCTLVTASGMRVTRAITLLP